ncbi:MAG: prolipoprotein diacylglyceryl transferase [Solirubrobacterales bacterium]
MIPELHLGPLTLQTFGLMFALSFIAAGAIVARRLVEMRLPADWAYEMGFAALVGGIVGARLLYVVEHTDLLAADPLGTLFGGTGLTFYGGLVGGIVAVGFLLWRKGQLTLPMADAIAPSLAVAYAVGRIGCQLSGDGDYGIPWDGPWAMAYPEGTVATTVPVHPTPIYETLAMVTVGWALWMLRDRVRPGTVFALYLMLAGAERLAVEFIRRNDEVLLGLTVAQLQSVGMLVAGAVMLVIVRRRSDPVEVPVGAAGPHPAR